MRALLGNLSLLTLGEAASKALGFLAVAWMARILGPAGFGRVSVGLAVLGYLVLVGSPGLHLHGTRVVAAGEADAGRIAGAISRLRLLLAGALWLGTLAYVRVAGAGSEEAHLTLLFALSLFPLALSLDWVLQGRERMGALAAGRTIGGGTIFLLLVLWVRDPGDIGWVPLAWLAGNGASSAFLLGASFRGGGIRPVDLLRPAGSAGIGLLRRSFPLGIGSGIAQAALHFPPILLAVTAGPVAVGRFSAAMRLVLAMMLLDRVVGIVYYPIASRAWREGPSRWREVSRRFRRGIAGIAIPAALGVGILAERVMVGVYGAEYAPAAEVLRVLVVYFPLTSLNSVYLFGLMAAGREGCYAGVMLRGTILQLAGTGLLGVRFGGMGAAAGFVAGEAAVLFLAARACRALSREEA